MATFRSFSPRKYDPFQAYTLEALYTTAVASIDPHYLYMKQAISSHGTTLYLILMAHFFRFKKICERILDDGKLLRNVSSANF